MKKKKNHHLHLLAAIIAIAALAVYTLFFRSLTRETTVINIKNGETSAQVIEKIRAKARAPQAATLELLLQLTGYRDNVHAGRYELTNAWRTFRALRGGHQSPVHLTIPSVRSVDDIASTVCRHVGFTKKELREALADSALIDSLGYNRETLLALFTPNTYDVYYDISARDFVKKMARETATFWEGKRTGLAQADSLTPMQVTILASIVQEETNIAKDKPVIAGLYINRLRTGMPLQSCPTIRFALQDFTIKRIYAKMLETDSPYNTYRHRGLPPGPIRNPYPDDIDAVLHYDHNDYLYMCASAKLDGTHHFTKTYEEHMQYSREYDREITRRGIR